MVTEKGIAVVEDRALAIHDIETRFAIAIRQRVLLEQYIKGQLKPDKHYYTVADGQKPSLTKEGAELICLPHGLKPYYDIVSGPEQPPQDDSPYQITVRCELRRGNTPEGQGIGSASSMVTNKKGERLQRQRDPGLRHNATLKMACKSAYNAATLSATAASEFFTQDLEDGVEVGERPEVDKSSHYCKTHDVNFFKKGAMKNYAHPIGETGKWCNETKKAEEPKADPQTGEIKQEEEKEIGSPVKHQAGVTPLDSNVPGEKTVDLSKLEFANPLELFAAANKHFNLSKVQVQKEAAMYDLSNTAQRQKAWLAIVSVYQPKEG